MIDAILDRLDALEFAVADQKRRQANFIRNGVVKSFDPDEGAVVELGDDDNPFPTHPLPTFTHAGTGKDWRPLKVGQQVAVLCPDGDLSNGFVIPGGYHDQNPAPSISTDEDITLQRGTVRMRTTDQLAALEADADSLINTQQGGWFYTKVKTTQRFVIFDGSNYWTISPSALIPASPPPKP